MTDRPHERVFVFEPFSDQGRHVLVLAQVEARLPAHSYVGPEHILLGIIHDDGNLAAAVLAELGVTLERARQKVEETVGRSSGNGREGVPRVQLEGQDRPRVLPTVGERARPQLHRPGAHASQPRP
jgi:ATP-dependent Clp protease ATP-binding subunit ClpA